MAIRRPFRRRATSYVLFLGTSMLVMVIGMSALMSTRLQRRAAGGGNDMIAARFLAQSAIEHGFIIIRNEPAWRTTRGSGTWDDSVAFGGGTYSLKAEIIDDSDGQPRNDPVVLTATGTYGSAVHKMQVMVVPAGDGFVVSRGSWTRTAS